MNERVFCLRIFALFLININSQYADYKLSAEDTKNVVLTDNFWLPKIKVIQDSTIHYAFNKCESEGHIDNIMIAGRKNVGKINSKNLINNTNL